MTDVIETVEYVIPALTMMESSLLWSDVSPYLFHRDCMEVLLRVTDWSDIRNTFQGLSEEQQHRWDASFAEHADAISNLVDVPTEETYAATDTLRQVVRDGLDFDLDTNPMWTAGDDDFLWTTPTIGGDTQWPSS